jgi:hypothetical protein
MTSSLLAAGPGPGGEDTLLLADFPESVQQLPWDAVNDGVMGGRSEGGFRLRERSLLFTGTTNTDGGGFSSIRSRAQRFDLGTYDGIRLRVRGDGRTYIFRLTTWDSRSGRYRPSYWAEFETRGEGWEEVEVPFSRFQPRWRGRWLEGPALNPGAVDSLGLMIYDGEDGPFRLEVDWIRAYREAPFSMEVLRWRQRPLLLFAPDGSDPRLGRQLAAVEGSREAFDERDMVLIVVLGNGPSRFEDRALTGVEAERLRATYEVEADAFALRLVGKDGGVKRRSDDVVAVEDLYAQIDAMPMRQDEMRR